MMLADYTGIGSESEEQVEESLKMLNVCFENKRH